MQNSPRILRQPAVLERVGFKKSKLWGLIGRGEFPKPVKLSGPQNGWVESEIDQWLTQQIDQQRSDERPVLEVTS